MGTVTGLPEGSEVFVPVPSAGRFRWRALLAAVVLAAGTGLGGYGVAMTVPHTTHVLVVTRLVPLGQSITTTDVRAAEVRLPDDVEAVRWSQADSVWGRPAAVPLLPGSVLSPRQIGTAQLPAPGQVLVAVPVAVIPAGVLAGSPVQVVVTRVGAVADGGPGVEQGPRPATWSATVVDVRPAGSGGSVVTLQLPAGTGERLALAAIDSHVSLVFSSGIPGQ